MVLIIALFLSFFLTVTAASCKSLYGSNTPSNSDSKKEEISFVAEVKWIPFEGGFYGLLTKAGEKFLPLNLPDKFKKDGLKIKVRGKTKEVFTIYMWGTSFEIYEIDVYSP
ncbi:MAG: hypothetical protein QMD01_01210 [Thermodesulfovibrionales bacterium]|nr:hypothetical protein [Thermodesulfovibrionales bacterium]